MKTIHNLTINGQKLEEWFDQLNYSNGIYFLDITEEKYGIHFKHNWTGKLMKMEYQDISTMTEESKKDYLDKLVLDLNLFQGTEPIIVFDKQSVEKCLFKMMIHLFEYRDEIHSIINRLTPMDHIFKEGWYHDSSFKEIAPEAVYNALFPGQSYRHAISNSYALFQMFFTIQDLHSKLAYMKIAA